MQSCTADVVIVSETWLTEEVSSCELIMSDDYFIVRKDRAGRRGGGVLVAIKKTLHVEKCDIISSFEGVWARIRTPTACLLVIACYKPPGI